LCRARGWQRAHPNFGGWHQSDRPWKASLFKPDKHYVYRVSAQGARFTLRRGHPSGEQITIEKV
jgi:hypothetical protein